MASGSLMKPSQIKPKLITLQKKGYQWIKDLGGLIQNNKLEEAGQKKNEGFELFDEIGEIQNAMNVCPKVIECSDSTELVSTSVSSLECDSFRVGAVLDQNRTMRTCYSLASNPSAINYTTPDLTGNFGSSGSPHNQLVPSTGQTALLPNSTYLYTLQTSDDNGATWRDISCPREVTTATCTINSNTPSTDGLEQWLDDGYSVKWSYTVTEAEFGQTLETVFESNAWTNGFSNWRNEHGDTTGAGDNTLTNVVALDPIDNLPAMRASIRAGFTNGLSVVSNQFGPEGLSDRCIVFCHEYLTPSGEYLIDHPQVAPNYNGMYLGFGYYCFTSPGNTNISGGGTIYPNASSFRTAVNPDGKYFTWSYFQQYINATVKGRSLANAHNTLWQNGYQERWVRLATEFRLNSGAGIRDGEIRIFADGVLIDTSTGWEFTAGVDELAKGYGLFYQHFRPTNAVEERIYFRNFHILGRPNAQ